MDNLPLEDAKDISEDASDMNNNEQPDKVENYEQPGLENHETRDAPKLTAENLSQLGHTDVPAEGEQKESSLDVSKQENIFTDEQQQRPTSEIQTMSRKMDVPSNKVCCAVL